MDLELTGKVALVTGAAAGLGAGICRALAGEGVRVVVTDRDAAAATALADELDGIAMELDVSARASVDSAVAEAADRAGALDIVVSNVGLTLPDYLPDISDADVDRTFDVNMRGALFLTRAAAPLLRPSGSGRLIYIGSGSGMKASAGLALYSASKYFLHGLCVAAGLELGVDGVTANIVCPSDLYPEGDRPAGTWRDRKLVEISCRKEGVADFAELKAKRVARTPVRRGCTVQDVADLVTFLASPRAGFINAQVIGVNGGALPN